VTIFRIGLVGLNALAWPWFVGARVPKFFLWGGYRLYKHRIPMHPKHGPPLLYYPSVAPPIALPRALAFGANKLQHFCSAAGEGVKGC
jgi:hypothetical protein